MGFKLTKGDLEAEVNQEEDRPQAQMGEQDLLGKANQFMDKIQRLLDRPLIRQFVKSKFGVNPSMLGSMGAKGNPNRQKIPTNKGKTQKKSKMNVGNQNQAIKQIKTGLKILKKAYSGDMTISELEKKLKQNPGEVVKKVKGEFLG